MNPLQLSIRKLRNDGWPLVEKVEQPFNHWSKVRKDLFGFGDIVAVWGNAVCLIQTTSKANMSARIKKIQAEPKSAIWLNGIHRFIHVHGWFKRKNRWQCVVKNVELPIQFNDKALTK